MTDMSPHPAVNALHLRPLTAASNAMPPVKMHARMENPAGRNTQTSLSETSTPSHRVSTW